MWKASPRFMVDAENGEITIKALGVIPTTTTVAESSDS